MSSLLIKGIEKVYPGGIRAISRISVDVKEGEFLTVTGPAGCGLSSLLRMISGLEEPTAGELLLDGKNPSGTDPKERSVALISPGYPLYPHLTVYENLAFGLKMRKAPKEIIDGKVKAAAELLGLTEVLSRKPKAISGALRQRVALGRAIVREPKLYLFDEPFSGLDAELRARMRMELSKLHSRLKGTFVYVTHDPIEALSLGTRVAVLREGFLQQIDLPRNLYDYPANRFVAEFVGSPRMNLFKNAVLVQDRGGIYAQFAASSKIRLPKEVVEKIRNVEEYVNTGKTLTLGVRAEDLRLEESALAAMPESVVTARADVAENLGSEVQLYCDLGSGEPRTIGESDFQLIARSRSRLNFEAGETVKIGIDPARIHLFDGFTERTMLSRDAGYEAVKEFEQDAAYLPPSPAEMRELLAPRAEKKRQRPRA